VAPGDRVVLMLEADIEYAVALHAVWLAGAVVVPLAPTTKADKLAFVIDETEATALLAHARLAALATPLRARCPSLRVLRLDSDFGDGGAPAVIAASPRVSEGSLAALIYTSGSTGRPKGVMLSHRNMTGAWAMVQDYLGLAESDVIGLALPPTYSYGLYNLLMGLGVGATVVIERQAAFPIKLAEGLARERVTVLPGVPTLFASLLNLPSLADHDLSAIRLVTNAAAALPVREVRRLRAALPHARLLLMYGMTECKRISWLPAEEVDRRPDSVGRGMTGQDHWLADEHGVPLPSGAAGATGELVVRGPHVMQGYWRRPDETAERLRDGPAGCELHTGDLFRADALGYLYFVARLDDIIKTRGEKVAPREVEEAVLQLSDVTGCAVIGVPDELLGAAVKAYVTLRAGSLLTPRDIVRHCQSRLESHMVPRAVEVLDALPTTESGKVRHADLRGR
jgi:long-chain acyl-CoA synthetase